MPEQLLVALFASEPLLVLGPVYIEYVFYLEGVVGVGGGMGVLQVFRHHLVFLILGRQWPEVRVQFGVVLV